MRFQYTGPGPIDVREFGGDLIRPGDIREFDQEPDWGPWECIDPDPEPEAAAEPAPVPAPFLAAPITPKGF